MSVLHPSPHGDQEFQAKVLGKPVFGIRLGEHIDEIRKRFKVNPVKPTNDKKRDLALQKKDCTWEINIANKKIEKLEIETFEGIVYLICVYLRDASSEAIKRQIATVYGAYIKDEGEMEIDSGYMFILEVDGEKILIKILTYPGCYLFYQYLNLYEYKEHLYQDSTLKGVTEGL